MENEVLWNLLANPADIRHSHIFTIQMLVDDFPQSGILRALLVNSSNEQNVKQAAPYFNPVTLYKLVKDPDSIKGITPEQIAYVEEPLKIISPVLNNYIFNNGPAEPEEEVITESTEDNKVAEQEETPLYVIDPVFKEQEYIHPRTEEKSVIEEQKELPPVIAEQDIANLPENENVFSQVEPGHVIEESVNYTVEENSLAKAYEEHLTKTTDETIIEAESVYTGAEDKVEYFHQDIDDEIYDEIVSIEDIGLEQLAILKAQAADTADEVNEAREPDLTEEQDISHIAATDHFVLDSSFAEEDEPADNETDVQVFQPIAIQEEIAIPVAETTHDISRYNDEKMPYTFMWWLDKTRKEHATAYQPYVNNTSTGEQGVKKNAVDELQQQYFENIFNLNATEELGRSTALKTDKFNTERKEDEIIKRFIQTEPQIKHPGTIKLDNENKAKKSSEDRDELVTETLARIYTEQMLYHKAVLTYKKLMLKFPEKSLYFASQIEQLEKKIN